MLVLWLLLHQKRFLSQLIPTIVSMRITIIQVMNRRVVLAPTGVPKSGIFSATISSLQNSFPDFRNTVQIQEPYLSTFHMGNNNISHNPNLIICFKLCVNYKIIADLSYCPPLRKGVEKDPKLPE